MAELAAARDGQSLQRRVEPHATVKDQVEACGVPHTEVAVITVDGAAVGFSARVTPGSTVDVYPWAGEPEGLARTAAPPQPPLRFVADVHLGKLARVLRLLGLDVAYDNTATDAALAAQAALDRRVLLTRDRGLLKRASVIHGCLVRSTDPAAQAVEVVRRFRLCDDLVPFSRCLVCGAVLRPVTKASVADRLPPLTRRYIDSFHRCDTCEHIYWKGAHHIRLEQLVERVLDAGCGSSATRPFFKP